MASQRPPVSMDCCPEKGRMTPAPVLKHFGKLKLTENPWASPPLLQVSKSVNNKKNAEDIHRTGAQHSGNDHCSSMSWCNEGNEVTAWDELHAIREYICSQVNFAMETPIFPHQTTGAKWVVE